MALFLNYLFLIIFTVLSFNILKGGMLKWRFFNFQDENGNIISYETSSLFLFLMFIIISGPLFLGSLALLKYLVYFICLLYIIFTRRENLPLNFIIQIYWIFYFWLIICSFRSAYHYEAFALLIKYLIPILSLYLGYLAFQTKFDLYILCKYVLLGGLIFTFFIGGLSAKFYSWLYFSPLGNLFIKYGGLADYFTAIFVLVFAMVWLTGKNKWYFIGICMLLSTLLETVRTGLGGITVVLVMFVLFRYKLQSLPFLLAIGALMISIVLFVPEVNQKFFGDKAGTISSDDILYDSALSLDNIQTSGREFMWELVINKFYYGNELTGAGLGTSVTYLRWYKENVQFTMDLLHNDYVQLLCDTGLIGLVLFCLFIVFLIIKVLYNAWFSKNLYLKICGIIAACSMGGTAFSMFFDNVVSHSMSSLIIPFIFTGIYLKAQNLVNNGELS